MDRREGDDAMGWLARLPGELRGPVEELMALPLRPERALRLPVALAVRFGGGLRTAARGAAAAAAEELRNKAEVYATVRGVRRLLRFPDRFPAPLGTLVDRAYAQGSFRALWAVEGLGHAFAASYFEHGVAPRGLLGEEAQPDLPAASLLMLHAGIGLAFAEQGLAGATPWTAQPDRERTVRRFVERCRSNARPGYLGAALESLGLVTALFHPPQVHAVARALSAVAPEEAGFYWHGVGRSAYFAPFAFVPGSIAATLAAVRRTTAGSADATRHAVAGFAWGVAMVNLRQPQILEDLLVVPEGEPLLAGGAFANGIASALVMRAETTPGAALIARFCEYRPARAGELWEELVGRPGRRAIERDHPVLAAAGRLDAVFRAVDLEQLVAGLEAGAA